jgi:hypothetical protein
MPVIYYGGLVVLLALAAPLLPEPASSAVAEEEGRQSAGLNIAGDARA